MVTLFPKFTFRKSENTPSGAATLATIATQTEQNGDSVKNVAGVAIVAGAVGENEKIEKPFSPEEPVDSAHLIDWWREHIETFTPATKAGEKIQLAALTFLETSLTDEAVTHGWRTLDLFAVMHTDDVEVMCRRLDRRGLILMLALAQWKGTKLTSITSTHATLTTGSGAVLSFPKVMIDPQYAQPFWLSRL